MRYLSLTRFWLPLAVTVLLAGCGTDGPVHEGKPLRKWLEQLDSKELALRRQAVDALTAMGRDAVPALRRLLDHVDNEGRWSAATAFLRIDPQAALPEVKARLASDVPRMRLSMGIALIHANVEPGLAIPVLAELMSHDDYVPRSEAIKAFGDLGPQSTEAVPALIDLLRTHADADVRQRAAFALVRIGPGAVQAVDVLSQALRDPDARVREGAASALGAIGPAAKTAEAALRTALNDADAKVRFRARKSLEAISDTRREARAAN